MDSFATNFTEKNGGHSWVSNLVIILLGIESLAMVSLIALYDKNESSSNLFYLATIGFLMAWTIYFSWHSMVKENSFELTAFMSMAIIMSVEGIFFLMTHSVPTLVLYLGIGYFIVALLSYLICCYSCYMHFGKSAMGELDHTGHYDMLAAIKDYDMFISIIKLNFVLYSIISSTFAFYIGTEWKSFMYIGLALSAGGYLIMTLHSFGGIFWVTKENSKGIIFFIILVPLLQLAQAAEIYTIYKAPSGKINFILLNQAYVILAVSLLINSGIIYLGIKNYKCFGIGRNSIIRQTNDDAIKAAFL